MTEPTQPPASTSPWRATPTREVTTNWGMFYATCRHPERVRFSTDLTVRGGESRLIINRVAYSCSVEFTSGDIPDKRRSQYRRVDETWSFDSAWYTFRRCGERGDATDNARRVLYDAVLPALAGWLRTDDARGLMRQGATYWRLECYGLAEAAERALSTALQRAQDLASAIAGGHLPSDDEEAFLRRPFVRPDPP